MATLLRIGEPCPDRKRAMAAALEAVAVAGDDAVTAACEAVAAIRNAACEDISRTANYCDRCITVQMTYAHWVVSNRGRLGDERVRELERITNRRKREQ